MKGTPEYDRSAMAALPVARALEKGLVMRQFALGPLTRELLAEYMRDTQPVAFPRAGVQATVGIRAHTRDGCSPHRKRGMHCQSPQPR